MIAVRVITPEGEDEATFLGTGMTNVPLDRQELLGATCDVEIRGGGQDRVLLAEIEFIDKPMERDGR